MKGLAVYDIEFDAIEKLAEDNDTTTAEIVEMLLCYVEDMKREFNLE